MRSPPSGLMAAPSFWLLRPKPLSGSWLLSFLYTTFKTTRNHVGSALKVDGHPGQNRLFTQLLITGLPNSVALPASPHSNQASSSSNLLKP